MEIIINLPEDAVTIASRNATVRVAMGDLSPEIIAKLAVHGLVQKVSDAASGAKRAAIEMLGKDAALADIDAKATELALPMMEKAADALLAGEWSSRSAGDGASEETRVQRAVTRNAIKAKFGAKSPEWARFTGLSDDEQNAKLDANFAALRDKLQPAVDIEMKRREELRKAKAKLGDSLSFSL